MPLANYLKLTIGDLEVQVTDPKELPVSIDYSLEDPDNFQKKKSAEALSIKVPATLANDKAANTFHNPDILDLTAGEVFRSHQRCVIEANGHELLVGKAFLVNATHNDKPVNYEFNLYGDNADWMVDLQEKTLLDFLYHINFIFTKAIVMASWAYDGTNENLPYVFAPVRYRSAMGGYTVNSNNDVIPVDDNMKVEYMRPALSVYWLLYWGFKSVGYRIQSNFLNLPYVRRQVMPWTWGNFLDSDGTRLSTHNFLAKSINDVYYSGSNGRNNFYWDLNVSNDGSGPMPADGAFDANNDYSWNAGTKEATWQYKAPHFGILDATFSMQINYNAGCNGSTADLTLQVHWFVNGVQTATTDIVSIGGNIAGGTREVDIKQVFFTARVSDTDNGGAGTIVTAKYWLTMFKPSAGYASITANVLAFNLEYFKIPLGGTIDFQNYTGLKKYKFPDFLRGIIDNYNLSINTDSTNKVVVIEPTHPYSVTDNLTTTNPGYFVNDFIEWNGKEDLSKDWVMNNYSDYERDVLLKFKDDSNDGILKVIQDRNLNVLAAGKYVFPERFKSGKKEVENRFFAPTMHYEVDQWKGITGIAPQLVCLIPENISNTSNSESANTFVPKICYYKGNIAGVGGWRFDGTDLATLPFMFAVNYKDGGENDPILSYSDERIKSGSGYVLGKGLLKRFYWQRLAIMRNGQWYNTWFRLNNIDVAGRLHREYKSYKGHRWELIQIKDYKPLQEGSTFCLLRRWEAVSQKDFDNTFPSSNSVLTGATPVANSFDVKYAALKCLITDIPTT